MADGKVTAKLLRDHVWQGQSYDKGDEVEVYPHEERWLRFLGVAEGGFEEGEQLGGPDLEEDPSIERDIAPDAFGQGDQQQSGEEAEEEPVSAHGTESNAADPNAQASGRRRGLGSHKNDSK